jgi:Flp pilus assembly pilin Flp
LLLNRVPLLRARLAREDGQTIIEYAIVIGTVSLALIIVLVGSGIIEAFDELVGELTPLIDP